MTTALPQLIFDKRAQICLEDLELLQEVSQRLEDVGQRLASFELVLAEAQPGDPIFDLHTRLDGLDKRLTALDVKQRRPVPIQLYVSDPPAAVEKRPAVDLREAVDARDRQSAAIRKLDAELRALTARFDRQARVLDYLLGVNVTVRVDDLVRVTDRVSERDCFSALNGRMAVIETKVLAVEEKFNGRLDRCATAFSQMCDRLTAIEAKLGLAEVVKDA